MTICSAILVMFALIASGNAMADWEALGSSDKGATTVYVDPSTIARDGGVVRIWSMIDFRKAAMLSDGVKFLSWKTQYEFDCKAEQSRMLAASMHSGNMGKGELTHSLEFESPKWDAVPPDSNGEVLWGYACGNRYQREQDAQKHCPGDTVVWLNLVSGVFHYKGQHWYGRTRSGTYICKSEAVKEGGHPGR